ncbi:MAG: KEOPS complex kinase/ATPase Bud32, partial [Thermoprotei archaeon]
MEDRTVPDQLAEQLGVRFIREIASGAEAKLLLVDYHGVPAVLKVRQPKPYRHPSLDLRLRNYRTMLEAKLLAKASACGVRAPLVYLLSTKHAAILMEHIEGVRLSSAPEEQLVQAAEKVGRILGGLHSASILHGDMTPSNIVANENGLSVLDFGLGYFGVSV